MTLHLNKIHVLFQVKSSEDVLKLFFFIRTKEKSKAEVKQTFLERNQRHFENLVFSFRWNRPKFFGRFVRKLSKQWHTKQNDEGHVSEKIKSCFFLSIRYRKISQTQNVNSQSTERCVRGKIAQPKRDSAFEQNTRIVPSEEFWGCSQIFFLVRTKEKSKAELKQTFLESMQRHSGKLVFFFRWDRPLFSEGLYENHQNNCIQNKTTQTTLPKKSKAVFISVRYRKTSQTQDVKSQITERCVRG